MAQNTIGIDIGEDRVAYGLFDADGNIVTRRAHESDAQLTPEAFFDEIIKQVRLLVEEGDLAMGEIQGIGIGMPSKIHFEKGFVNLTAGLPKIKDFAAAEYISGKLEGMRVVLDNHGNTGALAEHRLGAGQSEKTMLFCTVGANISTGIIIDNQLFRGAQGYAGTTGHMIVTPGEGMDCICGNRGCLASYCAGSMIVKHVESWIAQGEYTVMTEMAGSNRRITAQHLSLAYERGDELATKAIDQMALYLGIWLYNVYLSFNIDYIVLGGGLLRMGRKLTGRIRKVFDTYNHGSEPVRIVNAQHGDDRGIIGAMLLLM
ncbi:ROK family protein [Christensenellaceae bacterium OttesenSCG-928-M15]|nr:ROK family protein [Christensenellaceae bacterium OttesenSCG-928-M15]